VYRLIPFALILALTAYFTSGAPTQAEDFIEIKTIINISSQAGVGVITTAQAEETIAKANEILKQARIKLKVVKVNGPTSASANAGNADGDSSMTRAERDAARAEGGNELDREVGAGKGIKITFGDAPIDGTGIPGVAVHHDRCAICKNRATSQLSGETIAHEIGHILTLTSFHAITSTQVADRGGHAADPNNFMNPSNTRTGTNITTMQAEEMRRKARALGDAVTQPATSVPAVRQQHGSGGRQDLRDDASHPAPPAGLNSNLASHRLGDPDMSLFFMLERALDPFMPMTWRYMWLFDIDNNPGTGVPMFGIPGVERGVQIQINSGGGSISGMVQFLTFPSGPNFPLPPAVIEAEPEFDDTNNPPMGATSIFVSAPYAPLNFSAPQVPMYLVSIEPFPSVVADQIDTVFYTNYDANQPELTVLPPLVPPASTVTFTGSGFTPFTTARLFLDDTLWLPPLTVNPDGSVGGLLPIPLQPPSYGFYFVTVIDDAQRVGFNVLHVLPCIAGDCNRDGVVNSLDIDPFILAVTGATNDPDILCAADVNEDGTVDGLDIQVFVAILLP